MDATSSMLAIMINDVEGLVMRVNAWQHMCKVHEIVIQSLAGDHEQSFI